MRDAGAQEGQQTEAGGGDVVAVGGAGLTVTANELASRTRFLAGILVELVQRPVAVLRLVQSQPFQPLGHRYFRSGVTALLVEHFLLGAGAAAAEVALQRQTAHAASQIAEAADLGTAQVRQGAAQTAAAARRQRHVLPRRIGGSVGNADRLRRIDDAGHHHVFVHAVHVEVVRRLGVRAEVGLRQVEVLFRRLFDLRGLDLIILLRRPGLDGAEEGEQHRGQANHGQVDHGTGDPDRDDSHPRYAHAGGDRRRDDNPTLAIVRGIG